MLIQKCEGIFMPMQLTEQYVFTSCSAMLCCETEMTVCWWSMCLNRSVQMQGDEQLEVLRTDNPPSDEFTAAPSPFYSCSSYSCLVLRTTVQSLPGCARLTSPRPAGSARLAVPRWWCMCGGTVGWGRDWGKRGHQERGIASTRVIDATLHLLSCH